MDFKRVATHKSTEKPAVVIELDSQTIQISHAVLTIYDTPAKLKAEIESQAGQELGIFVHFNDDDSVALATGAEPPVWPEDTDEGGYGSK